MHRTEARMHCMQGADPCTSGRPFAVKTCCSPSARKLPSPSAAALLRASRTSRIQGNLAIWELDSSRTKDSPIAARPWPGVAQPSRSIVTTASAAAGAGSVGDRSSDSPDLSTTSRFLKALYQFSRPHTMAGTTISILSISALAAQGAALTPAMLSGLAYALTSALLMNISIVGTNQLYDIEIDKVNKPYLPLASGEFSELTGHAIVAACTLLSFGIGWMSGSPALMATLGISWLLGLAYSADLPFMRWKRSPVLAACCILSIRAIAVQLGFYWHMRHAMGSPDALMSLSWGALSQAAQQLPMPVAFTVSFMLLFSVVIALFKDIPDAKGDSQAGLRTLTVQLGVAAPFWACIWILTAAYVGACGYSVVMASAGSPLAAAVAAATGGGGSGGMAVMPASLSLGAATLPVKALASIFGHGIMAGLLWWRALKADLAKKQDITDCYMYVWKLFYAEYILIPFFA